MLGLVVLALQVYFYAVLAWVILTWIPTSAGHPLGRVSAFLDRMIYPVLLPIRRVVPPLRLGGGALDLSPIILLIAVNILIGIVAGLG